MPSGRVKNNRQTNRGIRQRERERAQTFVLFFFVTFTLSACVTMKITVVVLLFFFCLELIIEPHTGGVCGLHAKEGKDKKGRRGFALLTVGSIFQSVRAFMSR